MDNFTSDILDHDVYLLGESSSYPNNWVKLDLERGETGSYHIHVEKWWRNSQGDIITNYSGNLTSEYSSSIKAIEALKNLSEVTYPDYSFRLDTTGEHIIASSDRHSEANSSHFGSSNYAERTQIKQDDRANTKDSNNNIPENLEKNPIDDSPDRNQSGRTDTEEPETEYTGGTFLEDVEHWIPSLFESAHQGVSSLKNELESDIDESNWFWKAAGTSALDVLDAAMSFTEGIPLGMLDTRRFGEGFAEGTWEGAKKDISRALNVLPQGKILKAADRALTASDVVESLGKGDVKGAGIAVGMGALAIASKGKGKKGNKGNEKSGSRRNKPYGIGPNEIDRGFRKNYVSKRTLTENQRRYYKRRVQELHGFQDESAQSRRTTGVLIAEDEKGDLITLVGSSQPRVPGEIRERMKPPREQEVRGGKRVDPENPNEHAHHAEAKLVSVAASNNYKIVEIFPSRNACWLCKQMRERLGIPITNP